jgi:hypothetical protein
MPSVDVQSIAAMTAAAVVIYAVASVIVGIAFVERALHLPRESKLGNSSLRSAAMGQGIADLEDANIIAQDGARLFAWYIRPVHDSGSTVTCAEYPRAFSGTARMY